MDKVSQLFKDAMGVGKQPQEADDVVNRPPVRHALRLRSNGLVDLSTPGDEIAVISDRNCRQSPLLRLPPEIRNRIFRLAFGGDGRHIHVYDRSLDPTSNPSSTAASTPEPSKVAKFLGCSGSQKKKHEEELKHSPIGPLTNCMYDDHEECFKKPDAKSLQLLGFRGVLPWEAPQLGHDRMTLIARTCRQIYNECALMPYMLNVFSFSPGVIGTWMQRRIPAQKAVITTLFAEHLACSYNVMRCLWGNASAQRALSRDSNYDRRLFQGWTALKMVYISRPVVASVYGRRCLCHGDLVVELEEDMQDTIARRICAKRIDDILSIAPPGLKVELLDW
ncbi:hypothetical protein BU16DRAFT_298219 [Lophium mytilinum]|uniref:DUF7730 domain-containing protein n=1 Tax=Lophium mytilinum TaxID=390894 RepID=A0A6A6R1Z7_9PEZI|nr:hypothetical protein BU16DRAFT_298219 [Lophium mytilinum]